MANLSTGVAHYLPCHRSKNRCSFTFFCNNTLTITTLRQLSKISVDNCVQQHEQTLGQLFQLGILCREDLRYKDKLFKNHYDKSSPTKRPPLCSPLPGTVIKTAILIKDQTC